MIEINYSQFNPHRIEDGLLDGEQIIQACRWIKQTGENIPNPDLFRKGGYTSSQITPEDKFTEQVERCIVPALLGQRYDGSKVSFLAHVTPTGFLTGFKDYYPLILARFSAETIEISREVVIAGGVESYFEMSNEGIPMTPRQSYRDNVDWLIRLQRQILGDITARVIPPKATDGSSQTNVYINTSAQRVFVVDTNIPKLSPLQLSINVQ